MSFLDRTALITGASSGIGLEVSREFAKRGYPLIIISNEEKIKETARELENQYGIKAVPLCMDLSKTDSAQKIFDYCKKNKIKVDILVNNAGIFYFKDVVDTPDDRLETIINLHIHTPVMLTRLFSKNMIEEGKKGHIMNMASVSSRMMMPGIALYSGTKSFLHCFSRAMRNEVYDKGVYITTISPGAVATNLYNLPPRYLKLGIFFGAILRPEKLAKKAVKKMFKRKAEYIPAAFINVLFIFIVRIMPEVLVRWIKRRIK